jgi:DNA-binding transcriptional LysR family regulator
LTPNIKARSSSIEVVRSLVANNVGYTLLNVRPRSNFSLDGRRIARITLAGEHRPMRLGIATHKALNPSRVVNAFTQRCKQPDFRSIHSGHGSRSLYQSAWRRWQASAAARRRGSFRNMIRTARS